jgi:hypothetical protein
MEIQFAHPAPMAEIVAESEALLPGRQRGVGEEFPSGVKSGSLGDGGAGFGDRLEATSEEEYLSHLVRCLYWSHFLSRWGDRYAASCVLEKKFNFFSTFNVWTILFSICY